MALEVCGSGERTRQTSGLAAGVGYITLKRCKSSECEDKEVRTVERLCRLIRSSGHWAGSTHRQKQKEPSKAAQAGVRIQGHKAKSRIMTGARNTQSPGRKARMSLEHGNGNELRKPKRFRTP